MARIETWLRCNLQSMVRVQELSGDLFTADNQANRIGVIVTDNNGQPVQLTGGVIGYIIRPDEATVVVNGSISSNRGWIDLPASAYAVKGPISIVIKNGNTTIAACHGYIKRSTTDHIIDPGHEVPSLSELLAEIANMRTATSAANTAAGAANSAAGAANSAATNANNKASAANTAAGAANTAATNANGAAGKINNMTVAASGLTAGSAPTVAVSDVNGHKHILFGIPKGDKGDPGKDFRIKRTFASIAQMEAYDPSQDQSEYKVLEFDYIMIDTGSVENPDTGKLYCYEPHEQTVWHYIGDLSGAQGIKGETGNGISSVQLNQDYTLTITFTDGSSVTTASIRGASGNETIDDTAGIGDTDLVYSADKLTKELSQKANVENVYSYKSKSGSIVTVDDAVAEAVKQMRIEIAPVQDLHGYDNPWPGGAGKNLFPNASVSGTRSEDVAISLPAGTYTISATVTSSDTDDTTSLVLAIFTDDTSADVGYFSRGQREGKTKTFAKDVKTLRFYASGNYSKSANDTFTFSNIQLESGSSMTDYAPYSNICPITGWSAAKVVRTGKNYISDSDMEDNGINSNNGTNQNNSARIRSAQSVQITKGSYLITANGMDKVNVMKYDLSGTYVGYSGWNTLPYTFTASEDMKIRIIMGKSDDSNITVSDVSGVTFAKDGQTYSITFPSSAGTVYGGTLTYNEDGSVSGVSGVSGKNFNDSNISWEYVSETNHQFFRGTISGIKRAASVSTVADIISSIYTKDTALNVYNHVNPYTIAIASDRDAIMVYDSRYSDVSSFVTALANEMIVYPIATSVTFTLTAPELLTMLQGYNTVYADCGNIDLLYAVRDFLTAEQADKERIYETISTPAGVQTISDGADELPMALTVGIEPVQDLHGYDNPWPAGGGKNLCPIDQIDFLPIATWVNLANGNANTTTNGTKVHLKAGDYYVRLTDISNMNTFQLFDSSGSALRNGVGGPFTLSEEQDVYIRVRAIDNTVALKFKIQIETGTSKTDWTPYSNICPISGWTEANVTRTGKNLFDKTGVVLSSSRYIHYAGGVGSSANYAAVETFLPCAHLRGRKISITPTNNTNSTPGCAFYTDMSLGGYITTIYKMKDYDGITVPDNANYMRFSIPAGYGLDDIQIEPGEAQTAYEPYTGQTYPITFPSEAGTVYGGTITVNKDGSGELVNDIACVIFNGTENYWSISGAGESSFFRYNDSSLPQFIGGTGFRICSHFALSDITTSSTYIGFVVYISGSRSYPYIQFRPKYAQDITVEAWKAYLAEQYSAGTPVTVLYKLATPVTYQLSAEQVKTLLGVNNVWADTGDILSIDYPADTKLYVDHQIAQKVSASQRLMELIVTANHEDEMKATKAYSSGNLMIVNGTLYKASTSIANGATLTENTNVTATTVAAELAALA